VPPHAGCPFSYSSMCLLGMFLQGPVQSLTVDCITWRASTQHSSTQAGSNTDGGHADAAAAAWLPINIRGVTLVVSKAAAAGSRQKQKASKHHAGRSPAAVAAARPAVSSVLAVARRLLPGVPIAVQDTTVQLKASGACFTLSYPGYMIHICKQWLHQPLIQACQPQSGSQTSR
jgi:hypothetical protein